MMIGFLYYFYNCFMDALRSEDEAALEYERYREATRDDDYYASKFPTKT